VTGWPELVRTGCEEEQRSVRCVLEEPVQLRGLVAVTVATNYDG
jgi:hypothetical protein